MKKSIFRWSAAVLVAASLGLALGGCGAKDKKTATSSAKASTSKVEKKPKVIAKRVQHLPLRQTIQLALRLKQVARQLQKTLVRPRMRLLRRKLLSLQNWWELG